MEENNQSAQSGTETNTVTTTNCSICRGRRIDKREAINRALGKGISYRDIEAMTNVAYRTIGNHAQHLPAIFKEAKEKGILEQPIDVWKEFGEQLAFAKELRAAAANWLRCPETGKITLEPRASEVNVIYLDPNDRAPSGEMKKKKANLQMMLERIEGKMCDSPIAIVSSDIRKFSFDALGAAETTIDKFAKLAGEYQKERENVGELAQLKKQIEKVAESQGVDYKTELNIFLEEYADKIKPDLKTQLISELNQ